MKDPIKNRAKAAAWQKANPERARARKAAWYAANKEKARVKASAWKAANKDRMRLLRRESRLRNIEKRRASEDAWKSANQERLLASQKAWRERHPGIVRAYGRAAAARRRARIAGGGGSHTRKDVEALLKAQRERCAVCRAKLQGHYHVDHVMPLNLGGGDGKDNLQALCPRCNIQKKDKHPGDFMRERGFLL